MNTMRMYFLLITIFCPLLQAVHHSTPEKNQETPTPSAGIQKQANSAKQAGAPIASVQAIEYVQAQGSFNAPVVIINGHKPPQNSLKKELKAICKSVQKWYRNNLSNTAQWLHAERPPREFFKKTIPNTIFEPYFMKKYFSAQEAKDRYIIAIADLHGDIKSLNVLVQHLHANGIMSSNLENPSVLDPRALIIFTGDLVDRGDDGVATFLKVLKLKKNSPEQVLLCRGNHEDFDMNAEGDFLEQLIEACNLDPKNQKDIKFLSTIFNTYSYLPAAIFIGIENDQHHTNVIKFCHGGFDVGSNPQEFLASPSQIAYLRVDKLLRKDAFCSLYQKNRLGTQTELIDLLEEHKKYLTNKVALAKPSIDCIGEMWGDIIFKLPSPLEEHVPAQLMSQSLRGGGLVEYSKKLINILSKEASSKNVTLIATIRGHQHNEETMPHILQAEGVHCAWAEKSKNSLSSYPLKEHTFITIAPTPCVYGDEFDYDYVAYAHIDSNSLTLTKHKIVVEKSSSPVDSNNASKSSDTIS